MAKERRNTVSLFDSMGKNKEASTKTVNSVEVQESESTASQQITARRKSAKTEESVEKQATLEDTELTEIDIDKEEFEGHNNIITNDINNESEVEKSRHEEVRETEAVNPTGVDDGDEEVPVKRRGRRRLNEEKDLQHIHIALPLDVYEKLEIGKKAYYNNKTTYIRNLILDDYERNKDYYERLPKIR